MKQALRFYSLSCCQHYICCSGIVDRLLYQICRTGSRSCTHIGLIPEKMYFHHIKNVPLSEKLHKEIDEIYNKYLAYKQVPLLTITRSNPLKAGGTRLNKYWESALVSCHNVEITGKYEVDLPASPAPYRISD